MDAFVLQVQEELVEKNGLLQHISMAAAPVHPPVGNSARKRMDSTRRCVERTAPCLTLVTLCLLNAPSKSVCVRSPTPLPASVTRSA